MGRPNEHHQWALEPGNAAALDPHADMALQTQPVRRSRSWKWLLVGINICALLSGIAAAAFLWLMALPPAPECDKLSPLSPDIDRLSCAEAAVQSGELQDLLAGLTLLQNWTPDRPLYREAQRLMDDWSEELLYRARRSMSQGNWDEARRLVAEIPETSTVFGEGQEIIAQWDNVWKRGEAIAAEIQTALKNQDWMAASLSIRELEQVPHPYWRSQQSVRFSQQVWHERKARKLQQDALKQAQSGQPEDVAKALDLASQMNPDTFARQDMQPVLNQWSTALLETGRQHWKAARLEQAIALANQVKINPVLAPEADHLIRLSEARKLALSTSSNWQTSPEDIFQLQEAIAAAQTIPSDSRFYIQAQDSLASWRQQVDDLKRLQMAQLMANLGTIETYRAAIAQAETIAPQRLRRRQAQTLAAHWRREIERLEDGHILVRARQMAEPGDIPHLREAIAEASRIPLGRALRGEAQGLIYEWNARVQRIEDEPFLTLARTQARQGNLQQAIRTASVIQSGRFLYPNAQASIRQWRNQIEQAEIRRRRALEQERAAEEARRAASEAAAPAKESLAAPVEVFEPEVFEPAEVFEPPVRPLRRPSPPPAPVEERSPTPVVPSPDPAAQPAVEPLYAPLQAPSGQRQPTPPIPAPVAPSSAAPPPAAPVFSPARSEPETSLAVPALEE